MSAATRRLKARGNGRLMVADKPTAAGPREALYFQRIHPMPPNTQVDQACGGYFKGQVMAIRADSEPQAAK